MNFIHKFNLLFQFTSKVSAYDFENSNFFHNYLYKIEQKFAGYDCSHHQSSDSWSSVYFCTKN